jgi:hypothetical protein
VIAAGHGTRRAAQALLIFGFVGAAKNRTTDPPRKRRITVQLPPAVGSKNQNELAGCVAHDIDRGIGRSERERERERDDEQAPRGRWDVAAGLSESVIRTQLMLGHLGLALPPPAEDEPAPPAWGALCRLEQMLRSRRDAIASRGRRSHTELLEAI